MTDPTQPTTTTELDNVRQVIAEHLTRSHRHYLTASLVVNDPAELSRHSAGQHFEASIAFLLTHLADVGVDVAADAVGRLRDLLADPGDFAEWVADRLCDDFGGQDAFDALTAFSVKAPPVYRYRVYIHQGDCLEVEAESYKRAGGSETRAPRIEFRRAGLVVADVEGAYVSSIQVLGELTFPAAPSGRIA